MFKIALIKEGKIPADNRVALTPSQCRWIQQQFPQIKIFVQSCITRCFKDDEYRNAGIEVFEEVHDADIFIGIKEVPIKQLNDNKTYLFFSHTKKEQPHNRELFQSIIRKKITLIDFECLTHKDGQRILGFGFFAGIVGAHNGMMAYGNRTGLFKLQRVFQQKDYRNLIHTYFGLKIPNVKIAVTGSGRVAHGILEIMNLMGILEVEPHDYLSRKFDYPVYVHLKGRDLYERMDGGSFSRDEFHLHPEKYRCIFSQYISDTDVLMNGVYWDKHIPSLFTIEEFKSDLFKIKTIADITNDFHGSVPINIGDSTIEEPVYGVNKSTIDKTQPYVPDSVDLMAIGNLPNELPRDASRYFGEQLIKFVIPELIKTNSSVIKRATLIKNGELTEMYQYLKNYAGL